MSRCLRFTTKTKNICLIVSILINLYLLIPRSQFRVIATREVLKIPLKEESETRQVELSSSLKKVLMDRPVTQAIIKTETPPGKGLENTTRGIMFCHVNSPWADRAIQYETKSNMTDWQFISKTQCPSNDTFTIPEERQQVFLNCDSVQPYMDVKWIKTSDVIEEVEFGSRCLVDVIDRCCNDFGNKVPNVAHFIWYGDQELGFFQYLTFISLLRFMKPCLILIHGRVLPHGIYWDYFINFTPNVIHVSRERPEEVYGHKLAFTEHASDLMRIEALQTYGGVYVDFDEVLLRPLEPLRVYEYTQGHELPHTLGSQLVMAKKNATFLMHWHRSYRDNYKNNWSFNALWIPWKIAQQHPRLIHVEGYNFTRPNWKKVNLIFEANYNWSTNYGMHLFIRWYNQTVDFNIIRTLNTTIGSVSRHVLFGNKELCHP